MSDNWRECKFDNIREFSANLKKKNRVDHLKKIRDLAL
jgi:hypothetical protein